MKRESIYNNTKADEYFRRLFYFYVMNGYTLVRDMIFFVNEQKKN